MSDVEQLEDFKLKLSNALLDRLDPETSAIFDEVHFDDDAFRWDLLIEYALINPDELLHEGLNEVEFTPENIQLGKEGDKFFGFHVEHGFPFLGVYAKPEFESPVAFLISLNNEQHPFIYVPSKGNNYDLDGDISFEWSDEDASVFDQEALLEQSLSEVF
jgi:hypothetical protein